MATVVVEYGNIRCDGFIEAIPHSGVFIPTLSRYRIPSTVSEPLDTPSELSKIFLTLYQ